MRKDLEIKVSIKDRKIHIRFDRLINGMDLSVDDAHNLAETLLGSIYLIKKVIKEDIF
jgi:hypothetical protein